MKTKQKKTVNTFAGLWINFTTRDFNKMLKASLAQSKPEKMTEVRITIDGKDVQMTFKEFKKRLLADS